jgi:hypothetical protein
MHPTHDEALQMINNIIKHGECKCERWTFSCISCLVCNVNGRDVSPTCFYGTKDERLLGMAFILTMPQDIKKSLLINKH